MNESGPRPRRFITDLCGRHETICTADWKDCCLVPCAAQGIIMGWNGGDKQEKAREIYVMTEPVNRREAHTHTHTHTHKERLIRCINVLNAS